jgi:hypothetical protein
MKLFKSLLLASATGMVAVSGASAADLATKKPSPVEYVRACYNPLWGTSGGFVIPGTQTCLRVGGRARFDYGYSSPFYRFSPNSTNGFRGGGDIFLDAITPSEFGNVRAFINMSMMYRTGSQRTGTGARWGQTIDSTLIGTAGVGNAAGIGAGTDFSGSSGFIQFAGFTFGRTASFFNTVGLAPSIIGMPFGPGSGNLNQAAYTAVLGNGFLATIAVEDPVTRRTSIVGTGTTTVGGVVLANSFVGANNYANMRMPNFVAALRLDQAWGSAELSGLVSEVRSAALTTPLGTLTNQGYASTKYGFAVSGGLKINLPMIAAGDALYLNGTYSDGIISAVTGNYFGVGTNNITGTGGVNAFAVDAAFDPYSGSLKTTQAWAINAGFQHFWTPTIATTLSGAYGQVETGVSLFGPVTTGGVVFGAQNGLGKYNIWSIGLLNTWSPVRGLQFAIDLGYIVVDAKGRVYDNNKNVFGGTGNAAINNAAFTSGGDSQFLGRFRVVRDF